MRIGGQRKTNCNLNVPGFGERDVVAITLGYGMIVNADIGESRRQRTFYPHINVPGPWYIELAFPEITERNDLHNWLIDYIMRITDQWDTSKTLGPMAVSIPSQQFMRAGYPTSTIALGDTFGTAVYKSTIQFASGVDPFLNGDGFSKYAPPQRDDTDNQFYPAQDFSHVLPEPLPPLVNVSRDRVWRS
jgi:hypothetical protein